MPGLSDFTPHVGKTFRFGTADLVLDGVDVHSPPGASHETFSMVFSGPPGAVLPEGSYDVRLDGRVMTTLHVMPIHTATPGRQNYQVIFN